MRNRIKQYQIIKKLGSGGMGQVYLASDTLLDRQVAIKAIGLEDQNNDYKARFLEEAKLLAKINHNNITTIYDYIEENSHAYIVMEYVDGKTLADHLISTQLIESKHVKSIVGHILQAVEYAHKKKIIHRDIKPQNIMIDHEGQIKIMDFGIALIDGGQRHTQHGDLIGTIEFMAPELLKGALPTVQSDLYSCGLLMYVMLTGHRPFEQLSLAQMVNRERMNDFLDRSKLSRSQWNFIRKACHINPNKRFGSAQEMYLSLENISLADGLLRRKSKLISSTNGIDCILSTNSFTFWKKHYWKLSSALGLILIFASLCGLNYKAPKADDSESKNSESTTKNLPSDPKYVDNYELSNQELYLNELLEDKMFFPPGENAHHIIESIKKKYGNEATVQKFEKRFLSAINDQLEYYCRFENSMAYTRFLDKIHEYQGLSSKLKSLPSNAMNCDIMAMKKIETLESSRAQLTSKQRKKPIHRTMPIKNDSKQAPKKSDHQKSTEINKLAKNSTQNITKTNTSSMATIPRGTNFILTPKSNIALSNLQVGKQIEYILNSDIFVQNRGNNNHFASHFIGTVANIKRSKKDNQIKRVQLVFSGQIEGEVVSFKNNKINIGKNLDYALNSNQQFELMQSLQLKKH